MCAVLLQPQHSIRPFTQCIMYVNASLNTGSVVVPVCTCWRCLLIAVWPIQHCIWNCRMEVLQCQMSAYRNWRVAVWLYYLPLHLLSLDSSSLTLMPSARCMFLCSFMLTYCSDYVLAWSVRSSVKHTMYIVPVVVEPFYVVQSDKHCNVDTMQCLFKMHNYICIHQNPLLSSTGGGVLPSVLASVESSSLHGSNMAALFSQHSSAEPVSSVSGWVSPSGSTTFALASPSGSIHLIHLPSPQEHGNCCYFVHVHCTSVF